MTLPYGIKLFYFYRKGGGLLRYPYLNTIKTARETIEVFGGYNANTRIGEEEFSYMENLSAHRYPVLSPRLGRKVVATPANPTGLLAKDGLCYTDGSDFVINGYRLPMQLSSEPKQLVSMGAYVIILPDKQYVNTADLTDHGPIEARFTTSGEVRLELCDAEGTPLSVAEGAAPAAPENMAYWLDRDEKSLKQWSESGKMWVAVDSTYVRISHPGIGKAFCVHDGVRISGLETAAPQLSGNAALWAVGEDHVVVAGLLEEPLTIGTPLTLSRAMPAMDFVVECGNRLWGCRYGLSEDGQVVNQLYACKLGDFKNWNCFMGLSTDSYAVSLGSDGSFTGAVTHLGYPLFFKEGCMHKIYGSVPSNFQVQTTACRGVQKGCHKSLALVGETLLYKSLSGVMAYDGSLPRLVSKALGSGVYHGAVAGTVESRYYISMAAEDGTDHLFVFDMDKGLWHREDGLKALAFCNCRGKLYCLDSENRILCLESPGQETIPFLAVTGPLGIRGADQKYVSRLSLRLSMAEGACLRVFLRHDQGPWEPVCSLQSQSLRSFSLPIRPKRCDHVQLRLEGQGDVILYSLTKTLQQGSELTQ